MKWLVGLMSACLLLGWGWFHFARPGSPAADRPGVTTESKLSRASPATPRGAPDADASGMARKCLVEGGVLYTNGKCPPGSREQPVGGGTVSVMPAGPSAAPASAPRRPAHVREWLVKPDEVNLKDKRMEEVIGK